MAAHQILKLLLRIFEPALERFDCLCVLSLELRQKCRHSPDSFSITSVLVMSSLQLLLVMSNLQLQR